MTDMKRGKPKLKRSAPVGLDGWTLPETEELAGVFAPLVQKCAAEAIEAVLEDRAWACLLGTFSEEIVGMVAFCPGLTDDKGDEIFFEVSIAEMVEYMIENNVDGDGLHSNKTRFMEIARKFRDAAERLEGLTFDENDTEPV